MDRRHFLRAGIITAGGAATVPTIAMAANAQTATAGESPYGSIEGGEPDENGVILPEGFTSRIVAVAGEAVGDTDYAWLAFPDGAATFDDGAGGWFYVCNSEVLQIMVPASGGVSAIHFGPDGGILDAYRILEGSNSNCAGGPTPWGTWLSCEENFDESGRVWECDPTGAADATEVPALGKWAHEAVAVDPENEQLYLTQDHPEGLLYRFTPDAYPDLSTGFLEAAIVSDEDGAVTWAEVADPSGESAPTRSQVNGATPFEGGEGIWYFDGFVYFTTKGDSSVYGLDVGNQVLELIYRANGDDVLTGVDNITVDAGTGDLYVAEDGGNMEVVIITPDGQVAPFARVPNQEESEITGPVFNPARDRLYFSSQRGPSTKSLSEIVPGFDNDSATGGVTYEISGPFRGATAATATTTSSSVPSTTAMPGASTTVPAPSTTLANAVAVAAQDSDDDSNTGLVVAAGVGVVALGALAGGALAVRRRNEKADRKESSQLPE